MKIKQLIFATGNSRKIKECKLAMDKIGVEVISIKLNIHEIQHLDAVKVTEHKAMDAYKLLNKPVAVNDTYWSISSLKGFPGAYMKDIDQWFSEDDWLRLMNGTDRKIICHDNVAYIDHKAKLHLYSVTKQAIFVDEPRGKEEVNTPMERLVSFDNGKHTLAELHDNRKLAFENPDDYCWAGLAAYLDEQNQ